MVTKKTTPPALEPVQTSAPQALGIETIVEALLQHASIAALVGKRIALTELTKGTAYPALVYQVPSKVPTPYLSADEDGTQPVRARVQINPLAPTVGMVLQIHEAVRKLMGQINNTSVAGHNVTIARLELEGNWSKDPVTGMWTRPADYMIQYDA